MEVDRLPNEDSGNIQADGVDSDGFVGECGDEEGRDGRRWREDLSRKSLMKHGTCQNGTRAYVRTPAIVIIEVHLH